MENPIQMECVIKKSENIIQTLLKCSETETYKKVYSLAFVLENERRENSFNLLTYIRFEKKMNADILIY